MLLGSLRGLVRPADAPPLGPVRSLAYFQPVISELQQQPLPANFSTRAYNSLCNICFLVSRDNLAVGMRVPRRYLSEYRSTGQRQFRRVMRSHLIPVGEDGGVWNPSTVNGFKQFRKDRLRLICSEFEKAAGLRLFTRP